MPSNLPDRRLQRHLGEPIEAIQPDFVQKTQENQRSRLSRTMLQGIVRRSFERKKHKHL